LQHCPREFASELLTRGKRERSLTPAEEWYNMQLPNADFLILGYHSTQGVEPMTGNEDGVRVLEEMHRQPPSPAGIGRRFVKALSKIREVRAVGISAFGQAFRITTVIDKFDISVCRQIYPQEARLYQTCPELEAEFLVVEVGDQEAVPELDAEVLAIEEEYQEGVIVSAGIAHDFVWIRQAS